MSDDEEQMHEEEEAEEEPANEPEPAGGAESDEEESNAGSDKEEDETPSGPSEAELAMQKRRNQQISSSGLDEAAQELLEENRQMRKEMEKEIQEMRERSEQRKREREEEERRIAEARAEEEARRKADEEERKSKKENEERAKREARAAKLAEFEKWKNPPKRNFVISKREDGSVQVEGDETHTEQKKSKEQLEAEKRAILEQRLQPLSIDGFDAAKLAEKAKELHSQIMRLEGEKYDLEKRFKNQQVDMQEMAERARQMNKVGKGEGSVKRIATKEDEVDLIQEKYAGAPAKIMMYSAFERQKDKRSYRDRYGLFTGPMYGYPAERIKPCRRVEWNDQGQPVYIEDGSAPPPAEAAEEEEE